MPYTTEEGGRINNFANEPKVYQAAPTTAADKRRFLIVALVGTVLVGGAIAFVFTLS